MLLDNAFYSFYKRANKPTGNKYPEIPAIMVLSYLLTFNILTVVSLIRIYFFEFTFPKEYAVIILAFFWWFLVPIMYLRKKRRTRIIAKFEQYSEEYLFKNKIAVNIYFWLSLVVLVVFFKPTLLGW